MYDLAPVGKYKLTVCTNLACACRGGRSGEHLKQKLGIGFGETTADGRFTLQEGECFGACGDRRVLRQQQAHVQLHEPRGDRPTLVGARRMNAPTLPFSPEMYGPEAVLRRAQRSQLAAQGLPGARRLRGAAPKVLHGEDDAGAGDRRGQESRLRGRGGAGFPTGLKWSFMPRNYTGRSTWSATPTKASRARSRIGSAALQPAHGDRGHDPRWLRDGRERRVQLHPRRDLGRLRALRRGARRARAAGFLGPHILGSRLRARALRAPWLRRLYLRRRDGAARIVEGKKGQPRFKPPFPATSVSMAGRPRSTTPRRSPPCRTSCCMAVRRFSSWASRTTAAPRSSPSPDM